MRYRQAKYRTCQRTVLRDPELEEVVSHEVRQGPQHRRVPSGRTLIVISRPIWHVENKHYHLLIRTYIPFLQLNGYI